MDTKELKALMEAYQQVYAPQEVEEEMKPLPKEKMRRQAERAYKKETRAAAAGDEKETNRQMQRRIAMEMPASRRINLQNKKMKEELDIFDTVLEFLQVEGFAETLEEAEWMMANELDVEDINAILGEADSLAAFQARREKRRAAMKKKTGYEGHDYTKPYTGPTGGDKPEQRRG